jgi:hypothetical protein
VDPGSFERLPLSRYFDGIGLLVARSDWTGDGTYVTFKAGDNFWSHVHLDQGSFEIYKGAPLAIDSGLYAPHYGSDHHMNYSYQTIAHNVITVTDPDDSVPAPGRERPRPIANDGGQRRVGSGWAVDAAPLDLAEWDSKRATYHTGRVEGLLQEDGLSVAVADLTPAYTNSLSGKGTFSHRTRRVERYWRVFGYDSVDDVVVVFDAIRATKASFRKRWLLHTLEEPVISAGAFSVGVTPNQDLARGGGTLRGHVLLPKDADIISLGGPGFEFFVDGRNYDERGTLQETARKLGRARGEPGAWRIEISPKADAEVDQFLVVMLPSAMGGGTQRDHKIRALEAPGWVGCEVMGHNRITRWWFAQDGSNARVDVMDGDGERSHPVKRN